MQIYVVWIRCKGDVLASNIYQVLGCLVDTCQIVCLCILKFILYSKCIKHLVEEMYWYPICIRY